MVMIYVAACFKKSAILTCGKGILVGENITVSQLRVILVFGKLHCTQG